MDKKLEHIFFPIVSQNTDEENRSILVDQTESIAFGGYRRSWGIGDLLVRFRGKIEEFHMSHNYGLYNIPDNQFTVQGTLPGRKLPEGGREGMKVEHCNYVFDNAYQQVVGYHQLIINPTEVLEYIQKRTMRTGEQDRVINILGFETVNNRQFAAKLEDYQGYPAVLIPTPRGINPLFIDEKNSLLIPSKVRFGEWVIVEPVGIADGRAIGKIIRLHEPGVRMAIQHFKSGLLMPGDPRYSLNEGESGNTIVEPDIETFPFLEGQNKTNLANAPMLTIQLDTFIRTLQAMSGYKRVELLYKNSFTPYVVRPFVAKGEDIIEVVGSSFSQYTSGKVVTL